MNTLQISIKNLREEIDEIDNRLIDLLCERMNRVAEIGKIKKVHDIQVHHPEREISLIQNLLARSTANGIDENMVLSIWNEIMKASKKVQVDLRICNE